MDTSTTKLLPPPNASSEQPSKSPTVIDVDKWFDEIQHNPSSSLIGKNLKSYAHIFKLMALKITTGFSSTLSSNMQKSFVSPEKKTPAAPAGSAPQQTQSKTQFASTLIPTMSSINLDRTLYDELKPCKLAMSMPVIVPVGQSAAPSPPTTTNTSNSVSSNSLLSNLLTQRSTIAEVNLDPINQSSSSSPHTSIMPQQQAQILTNYNQYSSINNHGGMSNNGGSGDLHENNIFNTNRNQKYVFI